MAGTEHRQAITRIRRWQFQSLFSGGTEAPLAFGSLKAWEAMHTLASIDADDPTASCKPFSKNRTGMVLGEGAAMLILEPWDLTMARVSIRHMLSNSFAFGGTNVSLVLAASERPSPS